MNFATVHQAFEATAERWPDNPFLGVLEEGKLRIRQKRVDLVNPEAAFGNIQLFM